MQQTAGIHIYNISSDSFDKVAAEIQRFFDELEDKPLYFTEWCEGLCLYKERGEIRVLSDVFAEYYNYDTLLTNLVEHLAESVPSSPMCGTYDLANDNDGPEFHHFEITAQGEVIWEEKPLDPEDVDDRLFWNAVNNVYGDTDVSAFYGRLFGTFSPSDVRKACDMFATICGEGAPPESIYEELGIDGDSLTLEELINLVIEYRDYIWANFDRTTMYSYVSFLVEVFTSIGIDIKLPEELNAAISELL